MVRKSHLTINLVGTHGIRLKHKPKRLFLMNNAANVFLMKLSSNEIVLQTLRKPKIIVLLSVLLDE